MATDRVRGRSRTRISPHPNYSGYIGGSTEFYGLQEAKIGHFGGFRRSGNRFEMRWICGMGMYPVYIRPEASAGLSGVTGGLYVKNAGDLACSGVWVPGGVLAQLTGRD